MPGAQVPATPDAAAQALRDVVGGWLADQGAGDPDARVADVALGVRRLYGVDARPWADALVRAGYAPPIAVPAGRALPVLAGDPAAAPAT